MKDAKVAVLSEWNISAPFTLHGGSEAGTLGDGLYLPRFPRWYRILLYPSRT
jgi:hypothetical protein